MLKINDTIVTTTGDTAIILDIDDTGITIEYTTGRKKGWNDYISIFDIKTH